MTLKGKIKGVEVKALLDTGSEIGIINEKCLKKMNPKLKIENPIIIA